MDDETTPKVECDVCGGKEYYKEAGHYYCTECQTQTQELQEHVFEEDLTKHNKKSTKKVPKAKKELEENKITSWECYNIILYALTQELIELGADSSLKPVVKCLWIMYLNKIQVLDLQSDNTLPKFQALNSNKDIKLLYGVRKRRRSKSSSESGSASNKTSTVSVKRDRSKKKRALALSQQEELSQKSAQESSVHNESMTTIQSHGTNTSSINAKIAYNKFTRKALKKRMSSRHVTKHTRDVERKLKCHPLRYQDFGEEFCQSPSQLSYVRLYSILYIGLLIIRDRIQLGDILRFIKEGHLSFHCYSHLFSDEYESKKLNMPHANNLVFSSKSFRQYTFKLAKFLNVTQFIETPNLIDMSSRYCMELNLPDELHNCVKKLILLTLPRLNVTKNSTTLPNYEGRVMCFIIFTLKLLFGLDGVTEYKFSNYASLLNQEIKTEMFDIIKWLKYLGYRDTVITEYHFPTAFAKYGDEVDSDLYLEYTETHMNLGLKSEKNITYESKGYLQVLKELKELQVELENPIEFTPSLTPFSNYVDIIIRNKNIEKMDVLERDFSHESIDFLLKPNKFLKLVNNKTIFHGGANENIFRQEIKNPPTSNAIRRRKKDSLVKIKVNESDHLLEQMLYDIYPSNETPVEANNITEFLVNWQNLRKHYFLINEAKLEAASAAVETDEKKCLSQDRSYEEHYNPFERFWMNTHSHISYLNFDEREEYWKTLPHSFTILLDECSRIIDQYSLDLLEEYHLTEAYLAYVETYKRNTRCVNVGAKGQLKNIIRQATANW